MTKRNHITIDSIYTQHKAGKTKNLFVHIKGLPDKARTNWGEFKNQMLVEDIIHFKIMYDYRESYECVVTCKKDGFVQEYTIYIPYNFELRKVTKLQQSKMETLFNSTFAIKQVMELTRTNNEIGSDPEVFVTNGKGELFPAFQFLKAKDAKNVDRTNCTARMVESNPVFWDGFQAEFQTTPDTCLAYHTDSIQGGLAAVLKAARKKDPDAKLSIKTVFQVDKEVLESSEEKHVQLGCMPSYNVYGMKGELVEDGRILTTRSAGGHIHFGLDKTLMKKKDEMVKALDAILGVACVSLFQNYDNPMRRRYYGLAGEYRTPPHGLEYRTLSNAWLAHPFFTNLVFDVSRICVSVGYYDYLKHWKAEEKDIIECINTCNVKMAQKILKTNESMFKAVLKACYKGFTAEQIDKLYDIFMKGMDSVLDKPEDIEANWQLTEGGWMNHGDGEGKQCRTAIKEVMAGKKVS